MQIFDFIVLHLIVTVVPDSGLCLSEAARVLKPGGNVLIFDKFLQRGERAWLRRTLNKVSKNFVTKLNVVFEEALESAAELSVITNEQAMAGGWFRLIELRKKNRDE